MTEAIPARTLAFTAIPFILALVLASAAGAQPFSGSSRDAGSLGHGQLYDVTQFGAVGDGRTDDTAAIQAAFSACWNGGIAPYGGIVEFPGRRSYLVTSTIDAYDGCQIAGDTGSRSGGWGPPKILWGGKADSVGAVAKITAFTLSANTGPYADTLAFPRMSRGSQDRVAPYIATFTAANTLRAGDWVDLDGFSTETGRKLNRCIAQVASATGSSFVAAIPCAIGYPAIGAYSDTGTATTANVVIAFDASARYQQSISNIVIQPKTTAAANPFNVGIYFGSRVDTGTRLWNAQVEESIEYGFYFAAGGINVDFDQGWRGDGNRVAAIYWRIAGEDSFGIANGTVDNNICNKCVAPASGGAVILDNTVCNPNSGIHFTSRNVKVEVNTSLASGLGVFTLYDCPADANPEQYFLDFDTTWVTTATQSVPGFDFSSLVMSPANDKALVLSATNSQFPGGVRGNTTVPFVGLPALFRNSISGASGWTPLLSYSPSFNSSDERPHSSASPAQIIGDLNIGQLWQYGLHASDFLYADTAFNMLPNGTTLYPGQILAPPQDWDGANGRRFALDVVYRAGTTGTPNHGATTCTGLARSGYIICSSAADLSSGQRVSFGSDANAEIDSVDATNPASVRVYFTSASHPASTYAAPVALSFTAPELGPEMQLATKSPGTPTSLAWSRGDMEQNSTAAANGVAAWVNVTPGTPGAWAGVPLGDKNGRISSAQIAGTAGSGRVVLSSLLPLAAATDRIGGSPLPPGCANQPTVRVPGATTGMVCLMSGADGRQPPNIQPQCFVSAANTVTPQLCTAVAATPAAQRYNIRVIP